MELAYNKRHNLILMSVNKLIECVSNYI